MRKVDYQIQLNYECHNFGMIMNLIGEPKEYIYIFVCDGGSDRGNWAEESPRPINCEDTGPETGLFR